MRRILIVLGLWLIPFVPSRAEIGAKDVLVVGRVLGFVKSGAAGATKLAIVYDPAKPETQKEAETVQGLVGAGLKAGAKTLTPVLVKLGDVGAITDASAFFLTDGLGAEAAKVQQAVVARKIPCSTLDIAQVQAGYCTVGVRVAGKIEIIVNKSAADSAGIVFDDAFKMLITEI